MNCPTLTRLFILLGMLPASVAYSQVGDIPRPVSAQDLPTVAPAPIQQSYPLSGRQPATTARPAPQPAAAPNPPASAAKNYAPADAAQIYELRQLRLQIESLTQRIDQLTKAQGQHQPSVNKQSSHEPAAAPRSRPVRLARVNAVSETPAVEAPQPLPSRPQKVNSYVACRDAQAAVARGDLMAAQDHYLQALQAVAQERDAAAGGSANQYSLVAGLQALKEAPEFATVRTQEDLHYIVHSHQTQIFKRGDISGVTADAATQAYYNYAQAELSKAFGKSVPASDALFGLATIYQRMISAEPRLHAKLGPKMVTVMQASLLTNPDNHRIANELGVILAQYGQLADAKRMLLHSLKLEPTTETWRNLATVHRKLGEDDLARLADSEARRSSAAAMTAQPPQPGQPYQR